MVVVVHFVYSYMVFYEMRTIAQSSHQNLKITDNYDNYSIFKRLSFHVFSISSATSSIFHQPFPSPFLSRHATAAPGHRKRWNQPKYCTTVTVKKSGLRTT